MAALSRPDLPPALANLESAPISSVMDHIVQCHHAFLKVVMPHINELIEHCVFRSGSLRSRPGFDRLPELFRDFEAETRAHMRKEEEILFPYLRRCEEAYQKGQSIPEAPKTLTAANMRVMEAEHRNALTAIQSIRKITNHYTVSEHSSAMERALMMNLRLMDDDTGLHIDLENEILTQRAAPIAPIILI